MSGPQIVFAFIMRQLKLNILNWVVNYLSEYAELSGKVFICRVSVLTHTKGQWRCVCLWRIKALSLSDLCEGHEAVSFSVTVVTFHRERSNVESGESSNPAAILLRRQAWKQVSCVVFLRWARPGQTRPGRAVALACCSRALAQPAVTGQALRVPVCWIHLQHARTHPFFVVSIV